MSSTVEAISTHPFLSGLAAHWLERLAAQGRPVVLQPGQRLFHEHERGNAFWLISEGEVTLDSTVPGGAPVPVDTAGAGTVVGWSWIFPPHQWNFGAVAAECTSAIEFDAAAVRQAMEDDEALGRELSTRFVRVVMDRLHAARQHLPDLYRRRLEAGGQQKSGRAP
jgi:CRP/FNR family transcriptional regulator, cyclic AMP receptor protein